MQKAQLAAALVATLGFALHGAAFAANTDNGLNVKEKSAKDGKTVKLSDNSSTEKGAEGSCKGKDSSCKGKDSSCKGKDSKKGSKKDSKKGAKSGDKTETKPEETK